MADFNRWSVTETARATGLTRQNVQYRAKRLGINMRRGLSYDDVKRIVAYQTQAKIHCRENMINDLRLKLKNDGFNTK